MIDASVGVLVCPLSQREDRVRRPSHGRQPSRDFENGCQSGSAEARSSKLLVVDKTPDERDRIIWQWKKGSATAETDFGDPANGSTSYTLRLYDETYDAPKLVASLGARAGGTCGKSPCWKTMQGTRYRYLNRLTNEAGIKRVLLRAGPDGKAEVIFQAKRDGVPMPAPFSASEIFDQDNEVTVQLISSDGEACFSDSYVALPSAGSRRCSKTSVEHDVTATVPKTSDSFTKRFVGTSITDVLRLTLDAEDV